MNLTVYDKGCEDFYEIDFGEENIIIKNKRFETKEFDFDDFLNYLYDKIDIYFRSKK